MEHNQKKDILYYKEMAVDIFEQIIYALITYLSCLWVKKELRFLNYAMLVICCIILFEAFRFLIIRKNYLKTANLIKSVLRKVFKDKVIVDK